MVEDKGKEKEPSETSKLEDSIEAFTKELEKLSIDDALECTEEMLEERERKADKLEKMLRLKMRMVKMTREEEAWKRSMVVEEESANVSMGVIPATPMGKLFRPSHQAGLTTMFGGEESKLSSEMSSPDASQIMSQVPSPSTKFSSSYFLEAVEEVRDTWRADLSDCCGCIDGSFGGLSLDFEEILLKEKGPEEKDWYREANSWSNCWWFNMLEGGIHQMRDKVMLLPWERAVWGLIGKFPLSKKKGSEALGCANFLENTMLQYVGISGPWESWRRVERFVEETKSLLKKVIRGDHVAWDVFIPAVQMAMNDRVLLRHGSRPFSVMFGRKMNGFDDYREVSWDEKEGKEWLENAKKWGKDVWEAISLKGKNYGTEVCDKKNEVGLKSRKRRLLKVNDLVMRVIGRRNKLGERWEGPFVVIEYDKKVGGYKLQEKDGKVLKNFVPIEKLKLIEEFEDDEDQEEYEILEVLNHRGPPSKREYFMKWAGKHEDSWLPQRKFVTTDCISDYWAKRSKMKGKGKEEE